MSFSTILGRRTESDLDEWERSMDKEKVSFSQRLNKLERSKGMQVFLWITLVVLALYAVFAFLYTTVIIYASGTATSFLWFWPVTFGIALVAVLGLFLVLTGKLPGLRTAVLVGSLLFWICIAVFLLVETVIFSTGRKEPEPGAKYVLILGAQVRGEVPSLVLNARISAAAEYLQENPEAIAVASGGKGSGEAISEAEAIRRGLIKLGIAEERILLEDASTSTAENLRFSAALLKACEKNGIAATEETAEENRTGEALAGKIYFVPEQTVLVTNDFHVFRATNLAENLGYQQVSGLGATEFFAVSIQYYVREFFAVIAELLRGNF